MPVYLGTTDITNIRVGTVAATKVYVGGTLAWPTSTPVTYAVIATSNTEVGTSLGTSNAIPAPAGVTAGDLLVAFVTQDNTGITMTASASWTQILQVAQSNKHRAALFARLADGTGSDALAVSGASDDYCATMLRIIGHGVTTVASDIKAASANNATIPADPPSLDAGTNRGWLWLTVVALDWSATTDAITAMPAGFTEVINLKSAASVTSVGLAVAQRNLQTQSHDPGVFTHTDPRNWVTFTVAIPPAP